MFALARLKAETHALIRSGEEDPNITEISYYAAHDDLFFADENNWLVRVLCVRNSAGELHDMYRASLVCSVCHICDSDTLLVCSRKKGPDQKLNNWLEP